MHLRQIGRRGWTGRRRDGGGIDGSEGHRKFGDLQWSEIPVECIATLRNAIFTIQSQFEKFVKSNFVLDLKARMFKILHTLYIYPNQDKAKLGAVAGIAGGIHYKFKSVQHQVQISY